MSQPSRKFYIRLLDFASTMSWKNVYRFSGFLNFLISRIFGYRKKVVLQNLRRSFPQKSETEILATARRFYGHLSDLIFETVKYRTCPPEEVLERIEGDISLVDRLYAEGKNILFLMGHRGNWELANLFSSLRFSHECLVVYRPLANPDFDQWYFDLRTRFGARMIPMNDIAAELRKPRDRPYAVVLANDQSPPPESAFWTNFLHQETGFFRGGEILARRNGLAVLYADFSRIEGKRGFFQVEISLICEHCRDLPKNEILERQIRLLERDIRQQPFNWLWSHRRWKHRRP
ncbi:lysophospholipid acyltransferase family protein [Persicitalea jodogahamensis]|uniref:Acetyltransferase n=1 Tax=Persicitalea jodogahamensis TaxID=402147 RepID=A0A8J3G915_9BACT|nr:lysophospholipid acyltransferase family protein [Persicitalea jodogahamensis]GHB59889.1 acetyltransferase [Persicitalea jodogahamensis]